jgi:hypothetical protein
MGISGKDFGAQTRATDVAAAFAGEIKGKIGEFIADADLSILDPVYLYGAASYYTIPYKHPLGDTFFCLFVYLFGCVSWLVTDLGEGACDDVVGLRPLSFLSLPAPVSWLCGCRDDLPRNCDLFLTLKPCFCIDRSCLGKSFALAPPFPFSV